MKMMKRRRYNDDSESMSATCKKPRSNNLRVRVTAAVPGFLHRKEEDLGLGENRGIQGRRAGTVKNLGNSVRIAISDERDRVPIGRSQQRTIATPMQMSQEVADTKKGSSVQQSLPNSRTEMLKVRFRNLILKSQNQLLYSGSGEPADRQEMVVSISVSKTTKDQTSPISESMRMQELAKQRKAARKKIESMTRTVDFPNNLNVMSDMAKIMGDSSWFFGYGGRTCHQRRYTNKE